MLEEVLLKTKIKKDVKQLSTSYQTSSLESVNSVINNFAPKMCAFSYEGQHCRQLLAALHFNENASRETIKAKDGTDKMIVVFPKYKTGEEFSLKAIKEKPTFQYVTKLIDEAISLCRNQNKISQSVAPPHLTASKKRPSLEEVIARREKFCKVKLNNEV